LYCYYCSAFCTTYVLQIFYFRFAYYIIETSSESKHFFAIWRFLLRKHRTVLFWTCLFFSFVLFYLVCSEQFDFWLHCPSHESYLSGGVARCFLTGVQYTSILFGIHRWSVKLLLPLEKNTTIDYWLQNKKRSIFWIS